MAPQVSLYILRDGVLCELNHGLVLVVDDEDDDDDRKPSIWAHLGCRITVSDGSSSGHLKRPHLLCFVLFQSRVPAVSRRSLSLPKQLLFLFLRLLEDLTGVEETNLAATTCTGPPPAAGGRNEPRRRKRREEEVHGEEENGDREHKTGPLWKRWLGA